MNFHLTGLDIVDARTKMVHKTLTIETVFNPPGKMRVAYYKMGQEAAPVAMFERSVTYQCSNQ